MMRLIERTKKLLRALGGLGVTQGGAEEVRGDLFEVSTLDNRVSLLESCPIASAPSRG